MRRLSDGSAMSEARRFKTLTLGRTGGGSSVGVAMPQATARNQMIIADATSAWTLLTAPSAQYQVLIAGADPYTQEWTALTVVAISDLAYAVPALTLSTANAEGVADTVIRSDATILVFDATVPGTAQPDDAAAAGSAAVAARRDHVHGIVCAAPASPSVDLAASAEGSGTSFARADHTHQLDQAIAPTWTALHTFELGVESIRSSATYLAYAAQVSGDSNARFVIFADGSLRWSDGSDVLDVKLYRSAADTLRLADTLIVDVGGVFNESGVDADFRIEAVGQPNAVFVEGSTGNVGGKTNAPAADWHIVGGTVTNKDLVHSFYRTQILEDSNVGLQLIGESTSTGMVHVILTGAPASGDNKHWIISHLGPTADNRFSIGYKTSSADGFTPHDPTEYLVISTAGKIGFGTNAIPHGGIGTAMFALEGANASASGPHIQITTSADNYPVFSMVNWSHDDIEMLFDAYLDGANYRSSDAGSSYRIIKASDEFAIQYDVAAAGAAVAWNTGFVMDVAGDVWFPSLAGVGERNVSVNANGKLIIA